MQIPPWSANSPLGMLCLRRPEHVAAAMNHVSNVDSYPDLNLLVLLANLFCSLGQPGFQLNTGRVERAIKLKKEGIADGLDLSALVLL